MLLFMAATLLNAVTMVSCGSDDEDDEILGKSIAKTTWTGTTTYADEPCTVTMSFDDGTNGIINRKGKLEIGDKKYDGEAFGKFTYTFDGTVGKVTLIALTDKSGDDMMTYTPSANFSTFDFTYDPSKNTITISGTKTEAPVVLKKVAYKQIKWVEEKQQ